MIKNVRTDISGFNSEPTLQLCRHWQQLHAFYPFSRNHNSVNSKDQDPAVWATTGHPEFTVAARVSMTWRYLMLRYLYTLFFREYTMGETVARPVFHEFLHDNNTHGSDKQFMWSRSVFISPFIFEAKVISSLIKEKDKTFDKNNLRNFFSLYYQQNQKETDAYLPDDIWYEMKDKTTVRLSHALHKQVT